MVGLRGPLEKLQGIRMTRQAISPASPKQFHFYLSDLFGSTETLLEKYDATDGKY